ncbi:MAG: tRNA (adenosine(37)-N6)-threonylcarbamoyltransferase complex dimerization subunit type 1 TsaB [Luteolibacter sp.]
MRSILILETSTDTASLVLVVDNEIAIEKSFISDRRHNAMIFEPLSEIMEISGTHSFDAVFVGSGPGSYSGTRVGIAAAQGASLVSSCKTVAIPSILGVAEAAAGENCLAVGDARRGSYWTAKIENGQLLSDPLLTDEIGFGSAISQANENGATMFSLEKIKGCEIPVHHPTAAGLWKAWQSASPQTRALWAGRLPQPIYLKPPHITPSKKKVFG